MTVAPGGLIEALVSGEFQTGTVRGRMDGVLGVDLPGGHALAAARELALGHRGDCKIRSCAQERGVDNCASCGDYACDPLTDFFRIVPQARETLDALRG